MALEHGLSSVSIFPFLTRDNSNFVPEQILSVVPFLMRENTLIIQTVAKVAYDCYVTAICSGKNADFIKSLGADECS